MISKNIEHVVEKHCSTNRLIQMSLPNKNLSDYPRKPKDSLQSESVNLLPVLIKRHEKENTTLNCWHNQIRNERRYNTADLKIPPPLKVQEASFQKGLRFFIFFSKSEIKKCQGGIFMQKRT